MFGLFAPKCPLDTQSKTWIERRMVWLAERFGIDRMRDATVITPTPEFFPDPYTPDEAGFRHTLRRVCGYMSMDPNSVRFVLADDDQMPNVAGLYQMRERSIIHVTRGQLADPLSLIATLTHEIAHELLLKGGHLTPDIPDHEQVTDLLPVFLGLGIFGANVTIRESSWSHGQWSGWQVKKQGYLSSLHFGYALGVFSYVRGENNPKWVKHLRPDAGVTMKAALGYLRKTDDSLFRPTASARRGTPAELADKLADPSPTVRLNALWDVQLLTERPGELLQAIELCLTHKDLDVRRKAVELVGAFGPAAARNVPTLLGLLLHEDDGAQFEAATALGRIGADAEEVVPALAYSLKKYDMAATAAAALARFGPQAAPAEPQLFAALNTAANQNDDTAAANLIAALLVAVPDAAAKIKTRFSDSDPESRRVVIGELLRQMGGDSVNPH